MTRDDVLLSDFARVSERLGKPCRSRKRTSCETLAQSVYGELPGFLVHLLALSQTLRERLDETR